VAPSPRPRLWPLLLALIGAVLLAAGVFSQIRIRSDMATLLPRGQTAASRMMLREVQSGVATSLILIGLEDAPAAALAATSDRMTAAMRSSGHFAFVENGRDVISDADQAALFADRYLLAPNTTTAAFETPALHQDFLHLLDGLQSSASPLVEQFGLPDPTGAFPALLATMGGDQHARLNDGVWFAPQTDRALLLARMNGDGSSLTAQDAAIGAVNAAFAQAKTPGMRLLVSGPAIFARDAAHAIRRDVERLSILSALLVAGLLIWRFRNPFVIAAIAVPLALSTAAAALAVQLAFGYVHGITIGFGMTMLGVTVDYPVLLIGHRKRGEAPAGTWARIGRAFTLAVITAALGLSGMALARFPGLAQLGLFSITGVITAALATRFILPRLIVAADLAPVSAGDPTTLMRIERLRHGRLWALLPVAAAAIALILVGGPTWEHDLGALSPISAGAHALDDSLRHDLGAPDIGQVLVVQGATAEAVLQREEALAPILDRLTAAHVISGADDAAKSLPSAATQRARQQALPDATTLTARIAEAAKGLPFTPAAFAAFAADVATARTQAPITRADLTNPALSAKLDAVLLPRGGAWLGIIAPQGVTSSARLAAAFAGQSDVIFVDVGAEMNGLVMGYTQQALPWIGAGALIGLVALLIGLRDPRRVARVIGAIAASLLVTVAILTLTGVRLSLIHIVALQFVAGVGLDYALFFGRTQLDAEERSRTLRTLITCNGMALLTFGLLCTCQTPLLRMIGETVAIGVITSLIFAFFFVGPRPPAITPPVAL
jgi:predicted exporter